ncbi:DUF5374 domain-containing protein [Gallibacterium melopsittaci]|uniref:DUF5374 domain-containing protein n=1 Tax=Gallibacterium melopsittaci TaxID=516063 RepID=A0ABV6HUU3_9PAST
MISRFIYGHSLMSILVALGLLSLLLLFGQRWLNQQQYQMAKLWQYAQALQIAENQQSLRFIQQPCQYQVEQNGIMFRIRCEAEQITVEYPLGNITIQD